MRPPRETAAAFFVQDAVQIVQHELLTIRGRRKRGGGTRKRHRRASSGRPVVAKTPATLTMRSEVCQERVLTPQMELFTRQMGPNSVKTDPASAVPTSCTAATPRRTG